MTGIKITRKPVRMSANMTPSQVKRKRITIQNKMNTLNEQMAELKTMCQHPNVDKKYRANTGNYDPSADYYWIDWNCQDCGKRWMTDQ